ncbi:hypothetical protein [Actinoplanes sp. NPDC020271]|uniref:ATP-dependent DNA ligase n=1 Tax=Actinoplanes sp. NPDC020271 TaxID=3363896 RepID=UPI0037B43867
MSAQLVAFDLLAELGRVLLDRPLRERRARLQQLLDATPPALVLCPQTTDVAEGRAWMRDWAATGVEGLVVKVLAGRYTPGRAGWSKYKTRLTTEAVIAGLTG